MSVAPFHPLPPQATFTNEAIFKLTVDQYHELIRSGKLGEDDPVELLEGILLYKMPKNTPHVSTNKLIRHHVERLLPAGWHFQSQDPITLIDGEPEPDGAIIRGAIEAYRSSNPGPQDVAVVIEVADSSLPRDRGIKLRSYARAGIPVYWIVNVNERLIEEYSVPLQDTSPACYNSRTVHSGNARINVLIDGVVVAGLDLAAIFPST